MRLNQVYFAGVVALTACAAIPSWSGYDAQINALVGHDINEAIAFLAAPTRVVDMAHGHHLYVWEKMSDAHTAVRGTKKWNLKTQQEEIVIDGGDRIPFDCTTEIEADETGRVTRTTSSGAACLGWAPKAATATPNPAG